MTSSTTAPARSSGSSAVPGKPGRSGTNDGDLLSSPGLRCGWNHPAHLESSVNDSALDGFDSDRVFIDAKNTSTFTRGWTDSAGELGKIVRHQ